MLIAIKKKKIVHVYSVITSPNKGGFPAIRIEKQTRSRHLRELYCQWSQHFISCLNAKYVN